MHNICEELGAKILNLFLSVLMVMTTNDPSIFCCCWTPAAPVMEMCSVKVLLALSIRNGIRCLDKGYIQAGAGSCCSSSASCMDESPDKMHQSSCEKPCSRTLWHNSLSWGISLCSPGSEFPWSHWGWVLPLPRALCNQSQSFDVCQQPQLREMLFLHLIFHLSLQ